MAIIFPPMCVRNTHGRLLRGGAEAGVAHDQLAAIRPVKQLRQLAQHYRLWPAHIDELLIICRFECAKSWPFRIFSLSGRYWRKKQWNEQHESGTK